MNVVDGAHRTVFVVGRGVVERTMERAGSSGRVISITTFWSMPT